MNDDRATRGSNNPVSRALKAEIEAYEAATPKEHLEFEDYPLGRLHGLRRALEIAESVELPFAEYGGPMTRDLLADHTKE